MKYIVIIWYMLAIQSMYAQQIDNTEWCPPGATWVYSSNQIGNEDTKHYRMYKYEKDTFAHSLNLKKINQYNFSVLITPENNKIRSKNELSSTYLFLNRNDSIFYYNTSGNLELLYIFSDNLGLSWIAQSKNNSFLNSEQYPIACDSIVYFQDQNIINALGFDTVNDNVFKYYDLTSSFNEWEYGKIYKNIGPSKSFFATPSYDPNDSCINIADYIGYFKENELVSYNDDIRGYSFNKDKDFAQFIATPIKHVSNITECLIYPNPTYGFLFIKDSNEISSIDIFNSEGRLMMKVKNDFNEISLENFAKGIYYLSVNTVNRKLIN